MKNNNITNSVNTILRDKFWDNDFGGFYSALTYADNPLTLEKKILNQAYPLLFSYLENDNENFELYLSNLEKWIDKNYIDMREQYGNAMDLGYVKDTEIWYQLAIILLIVGNGSNNKKLIHKSENIKNKIDKKAYLEKSGTYLSKMDPNWEYSIDGLANNNVVILSAIYESLYCYFFNKNNLDDTNKLNDVKQLLNEKNYFIKITNLDKTLNVNSKITLVGESYLIFLYKILNNLYNDELYLNKALDIVEYVNTHFWDKKYMGYFSFIDSDQKITIHNDFVALLTPKTPAKYSFDNAMFLLSSENIISDEYLEKALQYLITLFDKKNGGFFIGEGYFWSAPGTPVGPFLRSVVPPIGTAGVYYFGAKKFVNLFNKYPDSQALCGILFNKLNIQKSTNDKEITSNDNLHFAKLLYSPTSHKKVDLSSYLNINKFLNWVKKSYTSGSGYGWTPYKSPLGNQSDNTPAIFGTQHALADLAILNGNKENNSSIADWILTTQDRSGAFCEAPGGPSDMLNTYLAINALSIIGELGKLGESQKQKCVEYLNNCQNSDGGFGINPGYKSDMFHSNLAMATLYMLDKEPDSNSGILNYTDSAFKEDGGYSEFSIGTSDTYSCFRAISNYRLYGLEIPNKDKTVRFLQDCQNSDGGFSQDHHNSSSLIATYHAVASLYMLNKTPKNVNKCIEFLSKCQTPDGGISNIPGATTGTIDEGFAGIQSLAMLTGQLNKDFATIVS